MGLPPEDRLMACAICGSERSLSHPSKNGIDFVRCGDCGYVVASPMPTRAELDALYEREHFESSYNPDTAQQNELFQQRRVQYEKDRDHLLEFVPAGRILDYGCGNGGFLSTFSEGFERVGYELNPVTTEWLQANAPFRVLADEAELDALEPHSFDAATLRGVIEHLTDPEAVLALLASKLRPGGVLYLCATPNADSPAALVYGTDWNQFTPPFHLHFFSPRTLALMAARHGLALIDCRLPYLDTPYADADADGARFVGDVRAAGESAVATARKSPPFPGTMMSLVLRKVA